MKCSCCNGTGKPQTAASKLLFGVCLACNGSGKKTPSPQQLEALAQFAKYNGRTWKQELRHAWEIGHYPATTKDTASLQQVRNAFGPSWLVSFKLPPAAPSALPLPAPDPAR